MNSNHDNSTPHSQTRLVTEPSGYLFHNGSLLVLTGLLLISAWSGLAPLVVPLGLILGAAVLAKFWTRLSLIHVSCRRSVTIHRLFPGDQTDLVFQVVNRKPLPLPWMEVEDTIPEELAEEGMPPSSRKPNARSLIRSSSLLWYRRTKWKYRLRAQKRGYYPLGPISLRSGDLFGFYTRTLELPLAEPIIVYPEIVPLQQIAIPSLFPLGDVRSAKRIFQDPVRPIGLREYQPGDSLRHIHWKASARSQRLQVKVFEPTTTLQASLFLAADGFRENGDLHEPDFEWAISLAASIAQDLIKKGIAVGLFVNSRQIDSGLPVQILPGGSREQILILLEALAKVTSDPSEDFDLFLQRERRNLFLGNSLIFILKKISANFAGQVRELKEAGYKVKVIQAGDLNPGPLDPTLLQSCPRPASPSSAPQTRRRL
jgi:uncharacterized protein (DUF58 family)